MAGSQRWKAEIIADQAALFRMFGYTIKRTEGGWEAKKPDDPLVIRYIFEDDIPIMYFETPKSCYRYEPLTDECRECGIPGSNDDLGIFKDYVNGVE